MTAFPRYSKYKDFGVEWLGDVPEHWSTSKAKWLWSEIIDPSPNGSEELLSISQYTGVTPTSETSRSESLEGYRKCQPGDLAMNIMLAWQGGLGISEHNGIISPAYSVFRLKSAHNSKYLGFLYRTKLYLDEFARRSTGIVPSRWRLYPDKFGQVVTLLPPRAEQDGIVAFLDEKTAQIDGLIAKKQRQIELLHDQKAILINRAVTRGLHPNPDLQDSGIPWIGPIPKGWRVIPLKRMATVQNGVTLGPVYPVNMSTEVPYLRVANVQNGSLNLNVVATLRLPRRVASKYLLQSGDVLVAEGGDLDKLGRGCVWRAEIAYCIHQNHVFAVRTEAKRLLPEFLSTALGSRYGQRYFMLTGKQTTNLASTNSTALMNFPLATPPREQQELIMAELARIQTAFERARNAITSQIQTLQTLRSTLTAHAVTGKIKV